MSIIKITGLSFWLLGCCLIPKAQNAYQVQRFSTDNGLPSNGIKGLQWVKERAFSGSRRNPAWPATTAPISGCSTGPILPRCIPSGLLFLLRTRDGRIYASDETGDLFFVLQNKLQFVGQVKVDTRPTTFKLTGLVRLGKLFRQSSLQPPADFGFNWSQEQLVPLSESRLLLTHNDSLYDYEAGRPVPRLVTPLKPAPGSSV